MKFALSFFAFNKEMAVYHQSHYNTNLEVMKNISPHRLRHVSDTMKQRREFNTNQILPTQKKNKNVYISFINSTHFLFFQNFVI